MYGYINYSNSFAEIVLQDGRLFRGVEQPGGGRNWTEIEKVQDVDDFMADADGEWTEIDEEQIAQHLEI